MRSSSLQPYRCECIQNSIASHTAQPSGYHHRFSEEGSHFAASMPPGVERGAIRRLLDHAELRPVPAGETLTREGEPVRDLMYLADGIVKIETGDRDQDGGRHRDRSNAPTNARIATQPQSRGHAGAGEQSRAASPRPIAGMLAGDLRNPDGAY